VKVLRALAAIRDVKNFRVRTLMVQLGMDPSQPVLLYRLLVKEGRLAVALGDQVRSLEERCRQLEAKCRRIASEKVDAEAQADELLRAAAEKVRSLEAANSVLEERLAGAAQEVARAQAVAQAADEKIAALIRFLEGSDDLRTLELVDVLALEVCATAADEVLGLASSLSRALQPFRLLELRQWFKNCLRSALEPTEEERRLVGYRIRIRGEACIVCRGTVCEEEDEAITWAHKRCLRS